YTDGTGSTHSFLYANGSYTFLNAPGASNTFAQSIDSTSGVTGYYTDATGQHGFVYHNGSYTTLDDPLAFNPQTRTASGMNGSGSVVGYYQTASGQQHGF